MDPLAEVYQPTTPNIKGRWWKNTKQQIRKKFPTARRINKELHSMDIDFEKFADYASKLVYLYQHESNYTIRRQGLLFFFFFLPNICACLYVAELASRKYLRKTPAGSDCHSTTNNKQELDDDDDQKEKEKNMEVDEEQDTAADADNTFSRRKLKRKSTQMVVPSQVPPNLDEEKENVKMDEEKTKKNKQNDSENDEKKKENVPSVSIREALERCNASFDEEVFNSNQIDTLCELELKGCDELQNMLSTFANKQSSVTFKVGHFETSKR